MTKLTDVQFKTLNVGQKFDCYDMEGVHEKVCGNAAVCQSGGRFVTYTFGPDEIVRAYTGVCVMDEV